MSDDAPIEVSPEVKAALAEFLSAWGKFNNRERPDQREITFKCYAACRAINPDNPVVVAEALPELVEAAMGSAQLLKNHFEADPDGMGTSANDAAMRTLTVLTKLKARP